MNLLEIILCGVATWRISSIITQERIFEGIRKKFDPAGMISYLFNCMWCMSVWVGTIVIIFWLFCPYFILPFVLSAVAISIEGIKN